MNIIEACAAARTDKYVRRPTWPQGVYIRLRLYHLGLSPLPRKCNTLTKSVLAWLPEDIQCEDYYSETPQRHTYSLEEAIQRMREGKTVRNGEHLYRIRDGHPQWKHVPTRDGWHYGWYIQMPHVKYATWEDAEDHV